MWEETERAGLLLRCVAKAIDFIIIAAAIEIVPRAGFFAGLAYLLIGDGLFEGRSLGKHLVGLRVVSLTADRTCSVRESILRNCVFGAGMVLWKIPLIGWLLMLLIAAFEFIILLGSKEKMRLGDEIAKTIVIETKQKVES